MRTRLGIVLLGGIAGVCLFASNALAEIETVTVTAEKRAEDVQRVPIAVSAVTGDSLDRSGTIGFKELQNRVPSLRFGAGVTGGENVITMRGLGSQNTTPGGDSPVAYSVDGVYLQRTTAVDPEFYDVERIEVLRGPQGTLYGRNSVGGSVNVINNKPSDTFGGSIDGMIGNYSQHTIRGYLTGPIVDNGSMQILGRATGVWSEHDGYSTNLSTSPTANHNPNNQDFYSLRGQLLINFNPDVNLLLSASVNHNNDLASPNTTWYETPARYTGGATPIPLGSPCDFHTAALYRPRTFCHDATEKASNEISLYNATFNWNFDWATFTSVTGYSTSAVSQSSDGDGSDQPIAFGSVWVLRQHQISEEARLASNDDGNPLKWLAGVYYFWSDNHEDFTYFDTGYNDPFPFTGSLDAFTFISHGNTKTRSYAGFGQVDYDFAKTSWNVPLTLTVGARYTQDQKYGTNSLFYQLPLGFGPFFCPPAGVCVSYSGLPFTKTWAQWTGKVGLAYQVNDDLMLYASASRGYLSGGNIIGLANVYNPETLWSYEAGFKSRFWDDRAQLNVAAYHEDIKGLQVFIQSSVQSGINNVNGMTKVNGLEAEFTVEPVDSLQLNATLTLTDAHYGEYLTTDGRFGVPPFGAQPAACTFQLDGTPTGGTLCNFKGNNLNQTPPYSLNLGAQYTFDTSIGTITPRVDAFFSGRVDFLPDNLSPQKSYTQTNAHLTWVSEDQMYRIEAFVNNIENNDIVSNDGLQSISLGQQALEPDNFVYYPPRTFGVRLGVRF